jgi:hypothetical protein
MNRIVFPVTAMTIGLISFVILCMLWPMVSIGYLLLFHLVLQIGLVWMVIVILKNDSPSARTSGEKIYGDVDLGPRIINLSQQGQLNSAQGHW